MFRRLLFLLLPPVFCGALACRSQASDCAPGDLQCSPGAFIFYLIKPAVSACEIYPAGRVSVASGGVEGISGASAAPAISADGRYVAFSSFATNLVANDTNGLGDVFVYDRRTITTTRVSIASDGTEGDGSSSFAAITPDGRFVAFQSPSTNLVAGDTNGQNDAFLHDRQTGLTTRVSVGTGGTQATAGFSGNPAISTDGRYVSFVSAAANVVAGDTNGTQDVFVHDRDANTTTRVSVATGGTEATATVTGSLALDGRFVVLDSSATNLVAGDSNGFGDIFVHDRSTGITTRVSIASDGSQSDAVSVSPSISADGRYVTFETNATNLGAVDTNGLGDIYVHDRLTGITERVSEASDGTQTVGGGSFVPRIDRSGRYVAFRSGATNLVSDDTNAVNDVFLHDRWRDTTVRASVAPDGAQGNAASDEPALAADCPYVGFSSSATNIVADDTNGNGDAFIRGIP